MLSNLLSRFSRQPTATPLSLVPLQDKSTSAPAVVDAAKSGPKVAFTIDSGDGTPPVQVLFPSMSRQHRVEPEAVVHTLIYRDFERAVLYLVLHGSLRKEFGGLQRVPMPSVQTQGLRDDEVLEQAKELAKDVLAALRNPVTCPERVDPRTDDAPFAACVTVEPVKATLGHHTMDPSVAASPEEALRQSESPVLTLEGEFISAGLTPYKNPVTKKIGKPSFAVVLKMGDNAATYHGSDLERALRVAGVLPGDRVRLVKYPKHSVRLGARTVQMNIWDCAVVKNP